MRKWNWIYRPDKYITKHLLSWNSHGTHKRNRTKQTKKRLVVEEQELKYCEWGECMTRTKNRVRRRLFVDTLCSREK